MSKEIMISISDKAYALAKAFSELNNMSIDDAIDEILLFFNYDKSVEDKYKEYL